MFKFFLSIFQIFWIFFFAFFSPILLFFCIFFPFLFLFFSMFFSFSCILDFLSSTNLYFICILDFLLLVSTTYSSVYFQVLLLVLLSFYKSSSISVSLSDSGSELVAFILCLFVLSPPSFVILMDVGNYLPLFWALLVCRACHFSFSTPYYGHRGVF